MYTLWTSAVVAQRIGRRTSDQEVTGSTSGLTRLRSNSGQMFWLIFTLLAPVTKQCNWSVTLCGWEDDRLVWHCTCVKPRPHQQQRRSNIVECYKVECCFDIVAGVDGALQTSVSNPLRAQCLWNGGWTPSVTLHYSMIHFTYISKLPRVLCCRRIRHGVRQRYGLLPVKASGYTGLPSSKLCAHVSRARSVKVDSFSVQDVAQQGRHRLTNSFLLSIELTKYWVIRVPSTHSGTCMCVSVCLCIRTIYLYNLSSTDLEC